MARDMQETFEQIIHVAGGTVVREPFPAPSASGADRISEGGEIIHELGVVRMGRDPKNSALNGFCQAHEVKNLFVTDAACFVSNPDKNPTLTIMALSWRASEYLLDQAKKAAL
jgi:choline dehydrogenase-like flavoprotein